MQPITPYVLNACLIVKVQASNGIRTRVSALARQYIGLAIRYLQEWAKEVPVSSTLIKFFSPFQRAGMAGFEPAAFRLTAGCSTD